MGPRDGGRYRQVVVSSGLTVYLNVQAHFSRRLILNLNNLVPTQNYANEKTLSCWIEEKSFVVFLLALNIFMS